MEYLNWNEKIIDDFSQKNISDMYNDGYVFTRLDKGVMQQTRSIRIDLSKFELSSENRRVLRKGENVVIKENSIPFSDYTWNIGKLAKDFYDKKADGAFSANKIKELITTKHNFNLFLSFTEDMKTLGYTICYKNENIIHYCYPFYDLIESQKNMGLIMMTKTIELAKTSGLNYIYLGSLQRPSDVYKLQFSGIEWFDGEKWSNEIDEVKNILINSK